MRPVAEPAESLYPTTLVVNTFAHSALPRHVDAPGKNGVYFGEEGFTMMDLAARRPMVRVNGK